MSWIEAIIMGLIQGLTEFLPVSSSGHLTIAGTLFGLSGEENLAFAIVVHVATVLSTICILWRDVTGLFKGLVSFRWNEDTRLVSKILVSMIPVGIVGVFFKDFVEAMFGNGILLVGLMLLLTAALLFLSSFALKARKASISFADAFVIGIAQACAVMPGLSRSGSTIATGLLLGNRKEQVAKFSFLMVIIPVLGEAALDLMKGGFSTGNCSAGALICGFVAAFVSGALACKLMLRIVSKGKLIWFAFYCVAIGLFAVVYSYLN
ncbi:MAG: undecaprenyl-diphosphate phosphatase [Tannerella sp.]|jgi:undecaprenyl-diphosphatase|nr:undecaprenyl-diphosphate phosphatase [Tannerella sp.]